VYIDVEAILISLLLGWVRSGSGVLRALLVLGEYTSGRASDVGELHYRRRRDRDWLVHYGAYETQFLKRMRTRYPDVENASLLDDLISSAQNLLSIIYAYLYFPTYSNGLKGAAAIWDFAGRTARPSGWRTRVAFWVGIFPRGPEEAVYLLGTAGGRKSHLLLRLFAALCRWPIIQKASDKCGFVEAEYPQRFGDGGLSCPGSKKNQRGRRKVIGETRCISVGSGWDDSATGIADGSLWRVCVRSNYR
jgi:hypothetical protein